MPCQKWLLLMWYKTKWFGISKRLRFCPKQWCNEKSQRDIYGNTCILACWSFQLALTSWETATALLLEGHIWFWDWPEMARNENAEPVNFLISICYTQLSSMCTWRLGQKREGRKWNDGKMKSVALHFSFNANYLQHRQRRKNLI